MNKKAIFLVLMVILLGAVMAQDDCSECQEIDEAWSLVSGILKVRQGKFYNPDRGYWIGYSYGNAPTTGAAGTPTAASPQCSDSGGYCLTSRNCINLPDGESIGQKDCVQGLICCVQADGEPDTTTAAETAAPLEAAIVTPRPGPTGFVVDFQGQGQGGSEDYTYTWHKFLPSPSEIKTGRKVKFSFDPSIEFETSINHANVVLTVTDNENADTDTEAIIFYPQTRNSHIIKYNYDESTQDIQFVFDNGVWRPSGSNNNPNDYKVQKYKDAVSGIQQEPYVNSYVQGINYLIEQARKSPVDTNDRIEIINYNTDEVTYWARVYTNIDPEIKQRLRLEARRIACADPPFSGAACTTESFCNELEQNIQGRLDCESGLVCCTS